MAYFLCSNDECNWSLTLSTVKYHRNEVGKLVPDLGSMGMICPRCGYLIEQIIEAPKIEEVAVSQGKFKTLSDKDKKEQIKKRAKKNFDQFYKIEREQKRNEIISGLKEKFEGGIK